MPQRMRTQSDGRPIAESRGGGTGERVGKGGRGRGPRGSNDDHVDELNGQGNDQGPGANGNVEQLIGVGNQGKFEIKMVLWLMRNAQENVGNVIVNGNRVGCLYKEFLACNPKEYDGKGGVVVLTRWIEKMESAHDMSGCSIDQKVKYTAGSFVGKALTWWNSQIRTHEMQKLESELWNHVMGGLGLVRLNLIGFMSWLGLAGNVFFYYCIPTRKERIGLEPSDLGFKYEIEIALAGNSKVYFLLELDELEKLSESQGNSKNKGFMTKFVSLGSAEVHFLGHVINGNGIHVDLSKIEAVKN
ncbi:hypothetical protein Tco_1058854 [Tanacetum coccineum]